MTALSSRLRLDRGVAVPSHLFPMAVQLPLHRHASSYRHHYRTHQRAVTVSSSATLGDLATYKSNFSSPTSSPTSAVWFHEAIREVVRHLHSSPFLQLVRFGSEGFQDPIFSSFGVSNSVVSAPELWSSIAETLSCDTADVVVLVQRVDSSQHATDAEPAVESLHRTHSREMKVHVEEACRKLVASGVGVSILQGQVGDCCNEDEEEDHNTHRLSSCASSSSSSPAISPRTGIVPFSSSASSRSAVKVTALPAAGAGGMASAAPMSGYWGVVVQSRHHTGSEGCYLLKAVKSVPNSPSGCTCTHFSLTRVCQGEHLERQFVESWLV